MTLFQYPKSKHKRQLAPREFKRYRSYKRYLQHEFSRVCVYCRQPDSSAPNLNFGVDHYRPKGVPRFAHLVCDYGNLYYCCGNCNSRKNNDWPVDEENGPFVVNPCDHEMAAHLRFDAKTGRVEARTPYGQHTEQLLQLNDEAVVGYRLGALTTVRLFEKEVDQLEMLAKEIEKKLRRGEIDQMTHDAEMAEIGEEIELLRVTSARCSGQLPLPPLKAKRLGVQLLPP